MTVRQVSGKRNMDVLFKAIIIIFISLTILSSGEVKADEKEGDVDTMEGRERQVKSALSAFIYGIRNGEPEIAVAYLMLDYNVGVNNSDGERKRENIEQLKRFGASLKKAPGVPIVMIVKPRISWLKDKAIVTCNYTIGRENKPFRLTFEPRD